MQKIFLNKLIIIVLLINLFNIVEDEENRKGTPKSVKSVSIGGFIKNKYSVDGSM